MPHLLPIIGALVLASMPAWSDEAPPLPWFVGFLWLAVPRLLAYFVRRTAERGSFRRAAFLARLVAASGVLGFAFWLFATDWRATLTGWTGGESSALDWPTFSSLFAFAPFVVLELASIDASARLVGPDFSSTAKFHVRQFVATLTPFALFGLVGATVGAFPSVRIRLEEVALLQTAFTGCVLAVLVLGLPRLLSAVWETTALPPALAVAFNEVAERAERRVAGAHLWLTGGSVANAAVVGFTPGTRRVFVSDAIVSMLSGRELVAVIAHELGHVRRAHALTFGQLALVAFVALELVAEPLTEWSLTAQIAPVVVCLAGFLAGFGFLSRRFELEADLESRALTDDPRALVTALQRVSPPRAWEKDSWRHFSPAFRARFLERADMDPSFVKHFSARLDRVRFAAHVLSGLALVALLWNHLDRWSDDQAVSDLRLGHYESALDRDVDGEWMGELLRVLRDVPPELRTESEFERAAAEAQDESAAEPFLQLLALRGDQRALEQLEARDSGKD